MRTIVLSLVILPVVILFSIPDHDEAPLQQIIESPPRSGTAIIMTGAAARIPQQSALLEELYNRGLMKDVVFISGVSAGALNAVILNAVLTGKITWDEYHAILFSIENKDIFVHPEGRKLPMNTNALRNLLVEVVEGKLGYHTIGDLPIFTEISFTSRLKRNVYRMCSRKINSETDTTLNLVDIMMASSAIPIAFPPVKIGNVKTIPDVEFIDGGVGNDFIPFKALFDFQKHRGMKVERVYIVSKKMGNFAELDEELKLLGIENNRNFDRIGIAFDNFLKKHLLNRLEAYARFAPDLIYRTFVWIPDFEQDFLMFNFSEMEEQYTITKSWAQVNDPVPLGDFLIYNKLKRRIKE